MNTRLTLPFFFTLFISSNFFAQQITSDTTVLLLEENKPKIEEQIISEYISKQRDSLKSIFNKEVEILEKQITKLDTELKEQLTPKEEITKLRNRISKVEAIQKKKDELSKGILIENYNSAILNILRLEKDIKPLELLNASREFHTSLEKVSNPLEYQEFKNWLTNFRNFLEKNKSKDVIIEMVSNLINPKGELNKTQASIFFSNSLIVLGIEKFIKNLGKKRIHLKNKSQKMLQLLIILNKFDHDKSRIFYAFEELNRELEALKKLRKQTLDEIIQTTDLKRHLMEENYLNQTNEKKVYAYWGRVQDHIFTIKEKLQKDEVTHQMNTVQSLKIRFGELMFKYLENLDQYDRISKKYRDFNLIDFSELDANYKNLRSTFRDNFPAQKYINDAIRMYSVD
ncbi:hypothetical protein N9231_01735 [Saprospiraceae bacterium]|nr:hypothetical protein [Saprospiraceae bacterium]